MNQSKTVLVTGVFDVIHPEHINFLKKAKQEGDFLIVAIESDARVKQIKGKDRPINHQRQRLNNLKKLKLADQIIILPEQFSSPKDHQKFINQLKPDIYAISSHTLHQQQKKQIIESVGGTLKVVHQHNPHISSSKIIQTQS